MNFDPKHYPYHSKRNCVYAKNGMVATSQPLAAQAGLEILKKGGNAVDAAIATAACLTVVEPTSNGIGSDAFAIVWMNGNMYGLNASGYAPKKLTIDAIKALGHDDIPSHGLIPITIPGTPKGWVALSKKFGKLPLLEVLKPAINYARDGYPVSPTLGIHWQQAFQTYQKKFTDDVFKPWFDTFAPHGHAPKIGDIWQSEGHAKTLERIGKTMGDAFYCGDITRDIIHFSDRHGGFLSYSDFSEFDVEWVTPISVRYKGYDVYELPPNGQGILALMALNMLKDDDFNIAHDVDAYHLQIEAMKLAFGDGHAYVTDPEHMSFKSEDLLSETYGLKRRQTIQANAQIPFAGTPPKGGTVYLATADSEGNMVSYIQSNYMGFGSGIVIPGTGIALQNRGHNFSFDSNHPNALQPRKRPYHTIIPGFLTKDHTPIGPFGLMGGFMQPQGHLQIIMNTIDFHLNPQAALDKPRWQWLKDNEVIVEPHMSQEMIDGLTKKGHQITIEPRLSMFGRGQIIWRLDHGVYVGGTEYRTDGMIAAW